MDETKLSSAFSCPFPIQDYPNILLAHGGGGKLMHRLIEDIFMPAFSNPLLQGQGDSTVFKHDGHRFAFTTDSFVVDPLFFPGGDIGKLAICGTVNDLAMSGARPLFLSAGFIIEEGFPVKDLIRVTGSMKQEAEKAGVQIITGDTKVVGRGSGDGVFINTSGIGIVASTREIGPPQVSDGDVVILSGDIGRHGIAIMALREGIEFETTIESDCASLAGIVEDLVTTGIEIHCMRDLTRGGLGSSLVEISNQTGVAIEIDEATIPVRGEVRAVCEVLGLDPLHIANEGRFICVLPEVHSDEALDVMCGHSDSRDACIIGRVSLDDHPFVTMKNVIGTSRLIDMHSGEQLPRIC